LSVQECGQCRRERRGGGKPIRGLSADARSGSWLRALVVDFDAEAEITDHAPYFGGWSARCGEISIDEDGVGRIERQWLQAAQIVFAAAGNSDLGARMKEAEKAQHFQTTLRGEVIALFEGGAGHRMQSIYRDGLGVNRAQRHGEVDEIVVGFTHAHDASGAYLQSRSTSVP